MSLNDIRDLAVIAIVGGIVYWVWSNSNKIAGTPQAVGSGLGQGATNWWNFQTAPYTGNPWETTLKTTQFGQLTTSSIALGLSLRESLSKLWG